MQKEERGRVAGVNGRKKKCKECKQDGIKSEGRGKVR